MAMIWKRTRLFQEIFFFYLFLGLFSFGIFGIFFRSSFFRVTTLEIEGNKGILGKSFLEHLEKLKGENIFGIRSWELEQILEKMSEVKRATVQKIFPHTVRIILEERKPEVILEGKTGWICLDEEGVALPCSEGFRSQLIRIKGLGQYTADHGDLLKEALDLVIFWRNNFEYPLEELEVLGERLFIIRLQNGIVIKCEGMLNLKSKINVLRPYLREASIRSLRILGFDLQAGQDIVIMTGENE
ncbi:MAG: cell division protein FtsQ/DivIB [Candidatus Caldatribacteriaceae bacterium]